MTKLILTIALTFSAANAFAFSPTTLHSLISDVYNAHGWSCQGNACDAVWAEQIRSLNELVSYVDHYVSQTPIHSNTGQAAQMTARRICRANNTAPVQTLISLASAQNRGLFRLRTIQQLAGISNPSFCTIQVR